GRPRTARRGARVGRRARARLHGARVRAGAPRRHAVAALLPGHRRPGRRGALGHARGADPDRGDPARLRRGRAGAARGPVRRGPPLERDAAQPAVDAVNAGGAALRREHGGGPDRAVHLRLRRGGGEVPRRPARGRDPARAALQRHRLLQGRIRGAADQPDLVERGGGPPPARERLARHDGSLLPRQRLAPARARGVRAPRRVPGAARADELGGRRRGAAGGGGV
ncbi:MAG: hypothetical protein AVDCRST_MAG53-2810, partial [uncultured Solirubrobacteraceae bacterium]